MDLINGGNNFFRVLEDMLDFADQEPEKSRNANNPSRAYVRDAKAMAATPADVVEYPNAYAFVVDMPGIKANEIKVQLPTELPRGFPTPSELPRGSQTPSEFPRSSHKDKNNRSSFAKQVKNTHTCQTSQGDRQGGVHVESGGQGWQGGAQGKYGGQGSEQGGGQGGGQESQGGRLGGGQEWQAGRQGYEGYSYLLELLWWVGFITEPSSYLPPPLPQFCRKQQQQPLALLAQDVRRPIVKGLPWELLHALASFLITFVVVGKATDCNVSPKLIRRVVILDADMIIHGPIAPWELTAEKGKPIAAYIGNITATIFLLHQTSIVLQSHSVF
ncbi:hypothetical protein C1H46_039366 [Malus baccata]|uniref:SHSP domain-containing protein n=1 Tax=Malus baccata TaxID=106549 RepID=A0A540KM40_MALBA|nr:hypothetical protein C1H46_039366 [Malus baccata]